MVNDGMQLTTNGSDLFSARAGEAEEVWKIVDIKKNTKSYLKRIN